MSFWMQYLIEDKAPLSLDDLNKALKSNNSKYNILLDSPAVPKGEFSFGKDLLGVIEINKPGDDIFKDQIAEFKEMVIGIGDNSGRVMRSLKNTKLIVCLQVLMGGKDMEESFSRIDPLWNWLFKHRKGLLYVDEEGFYEGVNLILEI